MTVLTFIDAETTGLDPHAHMPWEVCWWRDDADEPRTELLPHVLDHADPVALEINRYHEREIEPGWLVPERWQAVAELRVDLLGVTIVGCNPGFDMGMLAPLLRCQPWKYRPVNIADGAMWIFGWDEPRGLDKIVAELIDRGYDVPMPDHSAEADVRATRAAYYALRGIRARGLAPL